MLGLTRKHDYKLSHALPRFTVTKERVDILMTFPGSSIGTGGTVEDLNSHLLYSVIQISTSVRHHRVRMAARAETW